MSMVALSETTYDLLRRRARETSRPADQIADELLHPLSYYYDRRAEIDQELNENTEERGRAILRERLGEEGYLRVTGQTS